jgi:hypothetical protein
MGLLKNIKREKINNSYSSKTLIIEKLVMGEHVELRW